MTPPEPTIFTRSLDDCLDQIHRSVSFRNASMDSRDPAQHLPAHLAQPLRDAIALFSELRIPYALAGGIAAMVYGRARFTEDLDFVASADHEQILAGHPDIMRTHHFDPACTWKLYHDSLVDIDIWKDDYSSDIAARAKTIPFAGLNVRIAEVHDLVAMKLRAARIQDDYDISEILKHTTLDESIVKTRVDAQQFEHYLAVKTRTLAG